MDRISCIIVFFIPGIALSQAQQYNAVKGQGTDSNYDYGVRIYDTRIGMPISTEPMSNSSPYNYAGNNISTVEESNKNCNRAMLQGFFEYREASQSFLYREKNRAAEKLGEIDVLIQYDIRWKSDCDHDLVVTKVLIGDNTPKTVIPYLYKIGDVINVQIQEVTKDYYTYTITAKGITKYGQTLYRIPDNLYKKP